MNRFFSVKNPSYLLVLLIFVGACLLTQYPSISPYPTEAQAMSHKK